MRLRRYQVAAWYANHTHCIRQFWTLSGARSWRNSQRGPTTLTHLFWWIDGRWVEFS